MCEQCGGSFTVQDSIIKHTQSLRLMLLNWSVLILKSIWPTYWIHRTYCVIDHSKLEKETTKMFRLESQFLLPKMICLTDETKLEK